MSLKFTDPETEDMRPRILVFGVGGAGGNAVGNMIDAELDGVDFVVANTDAQALTQSKAQRRIQIGAGVTEGLGAGSKPEIGHAAAEESMDEIMRHLDGAHMVFVTAGMGGGTGTGAAPVIARAAREQGVLTVAVVTKPFQFEGARRMRIAESGIDALTQHVDTLIVIPNQNLFRIATERTTFAEAFALADQVLYEGVRSVTDLMVNPGLINLDFADVRSVMSEMGKAMMGAGEAEGEKRAIEAAEAAISNPLLDDTSMAGARGVLINITGGMDMTLFEVDEAANRIRSQVDTEANIIVGSTFDQTLEGKMRVAVVATGIADEASTRTQPTAPAMPAAKPQPEARPQLSSATPPWRARDGRTRADASKPEPATKAPIVERAPAAPESKAAPVEPSDSAPAAAHAEPRAEKPSHASPQPPRRADEPDEKDADRSMSIAERIERGMRKTSRSGGLGFFGGGGRSGGQATARVPDDELPADEPERTDESPDLFADQADDPLEIPAFLRRQAN